MVEKRLQTKLIKFLKSKGCYVIKTRPGTGTPVGCPDVIALIEGAWLAFEVKSTEKSRFQPLQKTTIDKLDNWSYCKVIHSGNYDEVIDGLKDFL